MTTIRIEANNFDLIRLVAAAQVAILHVGSYIHPSLNATWLARLLECFPGVPIFFLVSGFLISRAYERSVGNSAYFLNRGLRIFPALHVCVAINLLLVAATGYFLLQGVGFGDVLLLYAAKTTFVQFYNPDFMRSFGDGVLNGSLWTICVELQFYILTPALYTLTRNWNPRRLNLLVLALLILSLACNRALYAWQSLDSDEVWWKLVRVSFIPWWYMFLTGLLLQRHFTSIAALLNGRILVIALPLYVALALLMQQQGARMDNAFSPVLFFPLTAVVFLLAYTAPQMSKKVLHRNDISYGIYIYHVPVMNFFLYYGKVGPGNLILILLISVSLAILSWKLIEKPALSLKPRSINPVAK